MQATLLVHCDRKKSLRWNWRRRPSPVSRQRTGFSNAVVVRDFDRAMEAARAADVALAGGEQGTLLGVPMTVKECFDVAGLPTTWGIPGTQGIPVTRDAVAVTRLKAAGAVVLGKTNVPFMLADWQSYNAVYGATNNPWDVTRTPGGSSGGSAAALAAGYVPLEFGTDIGGSLRTPAAFCGVYSHKPTWDLVPLRGAAPPGTPGLSMSPRVDLAVAGPMARSADDLMLALDVTAGPDDADAVAYTLRLLAARRDRLRDFKVCILDQHPLIPTESRIREAIDRFADRLGKAGCHVERDVSTVPDLAAIGVQYQTLLMAFFGADSPQAEYEAAKAAPQSSADPVAAAGVRGLVLSHRDWIITDRTRTGFAHQWRMFFREWDVVVCPVMPTLAFRHDHRAMSDRAILVDGEAVPYLRQTMWASIATFTGQPATVMPIGISDDGLPIGVQIIGPRLEDRTTIAFASLCAREFGGFAPPPMLQAG